MSPSLARRWRWPTQYKHLSLLTIVVAKVDRADLVESATRLPSASVARPKHESAAAFHQGSGNIYQLDQFVERFERFVVAPCVNLL